MEASIQSEGDVHLCLENEKHCFMEYHTETELCCIYSHVIIFSTT